MKMRWVDTLEDSIMRPGDVLPSGLALCCTVAQEHHKEDQKNAEPDYGEVPVTEQFLHRWDCILKRYAFEDCERLSRERKITLYPNDFLRVDPRPVPCMDEDPPTPYLALLDEFTPFRRTTFKNIPFAEGKDNFDIKFLDMLGGRVTLQPADFFRICWQIPELMALAAALSGMYGGIHLTAWNWTFPTYTEDLLWKVSCLCVAVALPGSSAPVGCSLALLQSCTVSWSHALVSGRNGHHGHLRTRFGFTQLVLQSYTSAVGSLSLSRLLWH